MLSRFTIQESHVRRVKRRDRVARWVISLGGALIILSVLAILVMITRVALPLLGSARAELLGAWPVTPAVLETGIAGLGMDEYHETGFTLDRGGTLTYYNLARRAPTRVEVIEPPAAGARPVAIEWSEPLTWTLQWSDGQTTLERIAFSSTFDADGARTIEAARERLATLAPDANAAADAPPLRVLARRDAEGATTRVALLPGARLSLTRESVTTDFLGNETRESATGLIEPANAGELTAFVFDRAGRELYAGTADGRLLRWDIADVAAPRLIDEIQAFDDRRRVTALTMVLGEISLAVGDERGGLTTWFPVVTSQTGAASTLRRIHELRAHPAAVTAILPSAVDKSLLSLDAAGGVHLDHMTSERHLLTLDTPGDSKAGGGSGARAGVALAALSSRNNGMLTLGRDGRLGHWALRNPHPEVSLGTLFGKVWYEHYREPAYVWQSSAATDDVEPKLSLVPLIFGTLKGTLYAMLFAVPLACLGALYTSQFMRPGLRRVVKPAVEIMAAVPSVVIGFLAALWLAPRVERGFVSLMLALAIVPGLLMLALLAWQRLEDSPRLRRLGRGVEFLSLLPVVAAGIGLALWLGPLIEAHWFGGSFTQWIYSTGGMRYDQRNCVIIAFALGFAVIPIVFTITEDALGNVPRSLTAASLALGASRWQTAWRVALPTASPGIFAAIMIGFGRAVGETMIVLMATGNTPIIDWSPFNGMRTLSANIAVEIPEAPVDGTLYRVLFLTAVLLFILTFVVNTVAELVRQRLRRKYGQL